MDFGSSLHVVTLRILEENKSLTVIELPSSGVMKELEAFGLAIEGGRESEDWRVVQGKSGRRATLADLACVEAALLSQGERKVLREVVEAA